MLIIAKRFGQLGNRLFLFANVLANAIENNLTAANPWFLDYAQYFPTTRRDVWCRHPSRRGSGNPARWVRRLTCTFTTAGAQVLPRTLRGKFETVMLNDDESFDLSDSGFIDTARKKVVFLHGWLFHDQPALVKQAPTIREFFRPLAEHELRVDSLIARARQDCDVLIGLHIRRGDFKTFAGGMYYYSLDEYQQLLDRLVRQFPGRRITVLVCSDETLLPDPFPGHRIVAGNGHLIEDLYALARCDYILGPPSTYSSWASFYGNKPLLHAIAPDQPIELSCFQVHR